MRKTQKTEDHHVMISVAKALNLYVGTPLTFRDVDYLFLNSFDAFLMEKQFFLQTYHKNGRLNLLKYKINKMATSTP